MQNIDQLPKVNQANIYILWTTILLDLVSFWAVVLLMNVISMSTVWALMLLVGIKIAVLIAAMIPPKKKATA